MILKCSAEISGQMMICSIDCTVTVCVCGQTDSQYRHNADALTADITDTMLYCYSCIQTGTKPNRSGTDLYNELCLVGDGVGCGVGELV